MNAEQDLIENAINIWRRLLANERNAGRSDIVKRAADLIALQDGNKFPSELKLTSSEKALGRWIADTIGVPKLACEETIPPGCKLPPLVFSPSYQFHLALAPRRTSPRPSPTHGGRDRRAPSPVDRQCVSIQHRARWHHGCQHQRDCRFSGVDPAIAPGIVPSPVERGRGRGDQATADTAMVERSWRGCAVARGLFRTRQVFDRCSIPRAADREVHLPNPAKTEC